MTASQPVARFGARRAGRPVRRLLPLLLTLALVGCGDDDSTTQSLGQPSPTQTPCEPSGKGTTDLAVKPSIPKSTAPAPTVTTVVEIVCGTGDEAKASSSVTVKYVGALYADASEFDSTWKTSPDKTFEFTIGSGVIPGFSIGATGMRVGGRRMVVIPPQDGYGPNGIPPAIPGNATLVFVLDLVKVG